MFIIILASMPIRNQGFRYPAPLHYYNYHRQPKTIQPTEESALQPQEFSKPMPAERVEQILQIIKNGLQEFKDIPLTYASHQEENMQENREQKLSSLSVSRMTRV